MADEFKEKVGQALRRAREAAGVPLTEDIIKNTTGYSKAQICNWEHGRMEPRLSSINRLASAYNTTPTAIVAEATGTGTPVETVVPNAEISELAKQALELSNRIKAASDRTTKS